MEEKTFTPEQLEVCERFAAGPNDAYTIHEAQRAVAALIEDWKSLLRTVKEQDEEIRASLEATFPE